MVTVTIKQKPRRFNVISQDLYTTHIRFGIGGKNSQKKKTIFFEIFFGGNE